MKSFTLTFSAWVATLAVLASLPLAFANAGSISIQSLSPGASVQPGTQVSFTMQATDFGSPLTYTVSDSFNGSSASNSNFNNSGVFSWTPQNSDSGIHNLTITGRDQVGNTALAYQQITVQGTPSVSLSFVSSTTVRVGQPLIFTASAFNISNPTFTVIDAFSPTSLGSSAMSSSGSFNWTPVVQDIGVHPLTITARNSQGELATLTQNITVTPQAYLTVQSSSATNVQSGQPVTFVVVPTGFTSPNFSVTDSFSGSTLTNSSINSSGYFSWTPQNSDTGTHNITIHASDLQGRLANISVTVTVNSNSNVALTSPTPGTVVKVGTGVAFQTNTQGFVSPTFLVQDSFPGSSLTNANMSTGGALAWVPVAGDIGTHTITVRASDSTGRTGSASVTLTVIAAGGVVPPLPGNPTPHLFTLFLAQGSTGPEVSALQTLLIETGHFNGSVTGYFGPITEAAVMAFQTSKGISPLGVVGPATRAALNNIGNPLATQPPVVTPPPSGSGTVGYKFYNGLAIGSSGTDVVELQHKLTAEGVYGGPITGYFGVLTEAGVRSYQAKYGIEQVGSVGPITRAALNR